jgi:hypothetical protein
MRREYIFDPFHECADSARQIAPMCHDEGHGKRAATKIGYEFLTDGGDGSLGRAEKNRADKSARYPWL